MLTSDQKMLVQTSFASLSARADDVAMAFYARLFELNPALRSMFKEDLAPQRRKLMQMLTAAVKGLDRPEQLIPVVQDLGRRHATYGVSEAHYQTVGEALLWTLEQNLDEAFTADVRDAWATVYGLLSTTMKDAARAEAAAA